MTQVRQRTVLLAFGVVLAGCASDAAVHQSNASMPGQTVAVQCTVTDSSNDTPCIQQARQACNSDTVHLERITSRAVIPATQGVGQAPMPIVQYAVNYGCGK